MKFIHDGKQNVMRHIQPIVLLWFNLSIFFWNKSIKLFFGMALIHQKQRVLILYYQKLKNASILYEQILQYSHSLSYNQDTEMNCNSATKFFYYQRSSYQKLTLMHYDPPQFNNKMSINVYSNLKNILLLI